MTLSSDSASEIAKEILHSGENLPVLPESGPQLLAMAQKPIDSIEVPQLSKLIDADPAMVAKILRLANSAYYGTINRISNLRQAIIHIGLEETINTVCYLFYKNALPKFPKIEGFSDRDYWAHSWACATANKMLGHPRLQTNSVPGDLYVAGLLHGIGKLFLALRRPDDFLVAIRTSQETGTPLFQQQMEVIGTTDGHVAYEVLSQWRLPDIICYAVKHYSNPGEAPEEFREIASLTQFAYFIANGSKVGDVGDHYSVNLQDTWVVKEADTPLSWEKTHQTYVQDIYSTIIEKSQTIFDMDNDSEVVENDDVEEDEEYISVARRNQQKQGFFSWLLSFFR